MVITYNVLDLIITLCLVFKRLKVCEVAGAVCFVSLTDFPNTPDLQRLFQVEKL